MPSPIFISLTTSANEPQTATITHWQRAGLYGVKKREAWGDVCYTVSPYDANLYYTSCNATIGLIEIATDVAIEILDNLLQFPIIAEQLKTPELVVGAIAGEFQHRAEIGRAKPQYLANQFVLIDWQTVFDHKESKGYHVR